MSFWTIDSTDTAIEVRSGIVNADRKPKGGARADDPDIVPTGTPAARSVIVDGPGNRGETGHCMTNPFFSTKGPQADGGPGLAMGHGFVRHSGGFDLVR